ncbi:Uu.00g075380.m01.CDS01 [Anthostomella pinea]|uniref:Uu.00g075380.m01.CDS01 n=1 Tax=Anthostomella pinea TaxID=933095 RepID=A0AAI8YP38_9PEZI|nr:Uu.00g075380.m01.CDS01 [Anthostomella pinea]
MAIIKALEEWQPELQGTDEPFEIIIDHKNLQYFITTKLLTQRQARWAEFLSQFNFQIVYRSDKQSVKPDVLSRRPGDTPAKFDTTDSRVAARQQTILPASRISTGMDQQDEEYLCVLDTSEDLDNLIDMAYKIVAKDREMVHTSAIRRLPWANISVDYITVLPEFDKLDVPTMVDAFIYRVFSLHGAPKFITSDRGTQLISQFWQRLAERLGARLKPSSAYHPASNGQTEIMNSVLEQYLRIYISLDQDDWVDHLPLAEFALNNSVSSTTKFSPFFANYGWNPRLGIEPPSP